MPASAEVIVLYVAFLRDIKNFKFATIQNYLTIVKHIHRAAGYEDPTKDSWLLNQVLRGVKRELGVAQKGATPLEPIHLHLIRQSLNMDDLRDVSFWVACLIGFFGLLRSGNFLVKDVFCPEKDLCLHDVSLYKGNYVINLKQTKTIQFREREIKVVLPALGNHALCPVTAVQKLLQLHPGSPSAAVPLLLSNANDLSALAYKPFLHRLNVILRSAGVQDSFSGHSLRRGGATWAMKCGLPKEMIQDIGFWTSDAYLRYLVPSVDQRLEALHTFGLRLPR